MNGEASAAVTRPAGFWIRAVALALDAVVFVLVAVSLAAIARRRFGAGVNEFGELQVGVVLYTLLFTALYAVVLHAATGQTVGKMLVGARVLTIDGESVPFGTSLLRYLAYYVSLGTLTFGFLMAGLRRDKRALHDLLAGTRVDHWPPPRRRAMPPAATAPPSAPPPAAT